MLDVQFSRKLVRNAATFVLLPSLVSLIVVGVIQLQGQSKAAVLLPDGFQDLLVASGIDSPTSFAFTPDGRILVAEKSGDLRVVKNDVLLTEPFLSVSVNTEGERGLIGVAVDPGFESNGFVYVYYTRPALGYPNRISRFTVAQTGVGDTADPASEVVILDGIRGTQDSLWHNGGALQFGADGMLYVGVGDFSTRNNAQDPTLLPGSILRLDVANYPNVIPADNPDWGVPGARGEIWAIGLRNPFSLAIDPVTGEVS